jgi:hypothetical protein
MKKLKNKICPPSYLQGQAFSAADQQQFATLKNKQPDSAQFPHAARWYNHIQYLVEANTAPVTGGNAKELNPLDSEKVSEDKEAKKAAKKAEKIAKQEAAAAKKIAAAEAAKNKPADNKPKFERKKIEVDCAVVPMSIEGREHPLPNPPPLGAGAANFTGVAEKTKDGKVNTRYVTTAIHYANGFPHIGHTYEDILADVIARYWRIKGRDTYFLTGTDEHGQKVAESAAKNGFEKPVQSCDKFVKGFVGLFQRTTISHDQFIRTSYDKHYVVAQEVRQFINSLERVMTSIMWSRRR